MMTVGESGDGDDNGEDNDLAIHQDTELVPFNCTTSVNINLYRK